MFFYFRRIRSPSIASELLTTRYNISPSRPPRIIISSHLHRKHTKRTTRASRGKTKENSEGKEVRKEEKREGTKLSETAGLSFGFEQAEDVVDFDCFAESG